MTDPVTVTRLVLPQARVSNQHVTWFVHVALTWVPRDPAAVTLHITSPGQKSAPWVFARDLIACGIHYPCGPGDITVAPHHTNVTAIHLRASRGVGYSVALQLPTPPLAAFLDRTYLRVPPDRERYEFDPAELLSRRETA